MRTRILQFVVVALIAALCGYYFGTNKISADWKSYKPSISIINKEPPPSDSTLDMSLFWNVFDKLENSYYDPSALDKQKMLNGAITGMVQSLGDPYTVYLPPAQNDNFKQGLAGQFEGIGAELGMDGKQIVVISPLDGMPAIKAGIRAGDAIVKVDGTLTAGWTLAQAVDKIRGQKGTDVTLTVIHKGQSAPTDIKITRGTITVKSVEGSVKNVSDIPNITIKENNMQENSKSASSQNTPAQSSQSASSSTPTQSVPMLGPKNEVAYIRLSQFGDNTNDEWIKMVNRVDLQIKKSNGGVKGLILDLRNNPGGYLTDATFIASEFLKSGVVVIEEKNPGEQTQFSVNRQGLLTDIPMIVLINGGSASASEIVAGALRDHNRAKLVGEKSFGKGTVQEAEDLGNGAGIHITIAKWLTPNGAWVHGKGLTPDVEVKPDPKNPNHDTQLEKAVQELIK